jgi:hypothetical protein
MIERCVACLADCRLWLADSSAFADIPAGKGKRGCSNQGKSEEHNKFSEKRSGSHFFSFLPGLRNWTRVNNNACGSITIKYRLIQAVQNFFYCIGIESGNGYHFRMTGSG